MRCDANNCRSYVERLHPVTPPTLSVVDLCPHSSAFASRYSSLLLRFTRHYTSQPRTQLNSVEIPRRSTSFSTGLTSSRYSSSIVATDAVSDDSDDEDVEYKGLLFKTIRPPGGVRAGSTPLIL